MNKPSGISLNQKSSLEEGMCTHQFTPSSFSKFVEVQSNCKRLFRNVSSGKCLSYDDIIGLSNSSHHWDTEHAHNEIEHSNEIMDEFLNLSKDLIGSCDDNLSGNNLLQNDQMDLHVLSEKLGIAIIDNGENPSLDDIYDTSQSSWFPSFNSPCKQAGRKHGTHDKVHEHSSCSTFRMMSSGKPRLRWTLELHEQFIEAVNKLDGPDKATPKEILKLMNSESLTIYHVKSHLQKCRLAKFLPDRKAELSKDKKDSVDDKEPSSVSLGSSNGTNRNVQITEALRIQMEVQKMLHVQLEMQRTLQLRVEEHARYLHKIIEEQQKASKSWASLNQMQTSKLQVECSDLSSLEQHGSKVEPISSPRGSSKAFNLSTEPQKESPLEDTSSES